VVPAWSLSWLAGIAHDAEQLGLDEERLEPRTRQMVRVGRRILARGGPGSRWRDRWTATAGRFLADYDVLLCPVVARGPGRAGELAGAGFARTFASQSRTVAWTQPWNLAGFPAAVAPVGVAEGAPLAVQLVGRPGTEAQLLAVAGQLAVR
jgi:amidase